MDFDLSSEQQQIADNLARLMKDKYGFEARKGYASQPQGYAPDLWRQYADLGLLGAPFAEEDGGYGGGAIEVMLTQEAFGRVELAARAALAALAEGDTLRTSLAALKRLLKLTPANLVAMRRVLADAAVAKGGYPFA